MAEKLNDVNVEVERIVTVADNPREIIDALENELHFADVVILTGGLGPTKDDMTKQVLCRFFDAKMVVHQPTLKHVKHYFEMRGLPFSELNHQPMFPDCCTVRWPPECGSKNRENYCFLPGVIGNDVLIQNMCCRSWGVRMPMWYITILTQGIGSRWLTSSRLGKSLPAVLNWLIYRKQVCACALQRVRKDEPSQKMADELENCPI